MANTGYKVYNTLEEYDTATGVATGNTKPNVDTDPDYVAPVYDTTTCPIPDIEAPVVANLTGTGITETSIDLSWSASDNVGITSQTIHYNPYNIAWQTVMVSSGVRSHTLTGLISDRRHNVYVTATDAAGYIGQSETLTFDTLVSDTEAPVIHNFVNSDTTNNSLSFSWLATDNVGITSQNLYYRKVGDTNYQQISLSSTANSRTISFLLEETAYEVYLSVSDVDGNTTTSAILTESTYKNLQTIYLGGVSSTTGYSTNTAACDSTNTLVTAYWDNQNNRSYPIVGSKFYNNEAATIDFDGGYTWYKYGTSRVLKIANNGFVTESQDCNQTLSVSPSTKDIGQTSGSFTFSVTSNTTWKIGTNTSSWLNVDLATATQSGNDSSVTVNYTQNTAESGRNGALEILTDDSFITQTIDVTQEGTVTYEIMTLGFGFSFGDACADPTSIYYGTQNNLFITGGIWTDPDGNNLAPAGYYSQNGGWRYWDGSSFTTNGSC